MKKIIIIGLTGSGKTVLANKMSKILNIPVYYLDQIFWKEKGHIKDEDFIKEQQDIMYNDMWIIDGGFPRSKSLDVRISNADTVIFYDLPFRIVFWRAFKRYLKYYNTIRPDFGKKQSFPFTTKEIKYAFSYPVKDIYSKLETYKEEKKIFFIKNLKAERSFLQSLQVLQK